jgi:hypothetical protein
MDLLWQLRQTDLISALFHNSLRTNPIAVIFRSIAKNWRAIRTFSGMINGECNYPEFLLDYPVVFSSFVRGLR